MKKKLVIALGIISLFLVIAWVAAAPAEKVRAGDTYPAVSLTNIHGTSVAIPSSRAKWVHLQFRRFAGCPICNLHMQDFVNRNSELAAAGIQEVAVFHSPKESLLPFQGKFPFDVVADPKKHLYEQFGVSSSVFAILDIRAWPAMFEGHAIQDRPQGDPEGGALGRPADFLIGSDGKVVASYYGRHAYDQWTVDEVLKLAK